MTRRIRSRLVWLLPLLVGGGMALGSLLGMSLVSDAALQDGPEGDLAAAGQALVMMLCLVAGFVMAMLAVVAAKLLSLAPPTFIPLRVGLSVVAGGVVGPLGTNAGSVMTVIAWLLLLGLPVLLVWPWRAWRSVGESPSAGTIT